MVAGVSDGDGAARDHSLDRDSGGFLRHDLVHLRPSRDEVAQLMEDTAGHALPDLGVELARLLQEETQGNPFFVGEMLRHLVETGSLVRDSEGRWAATTEFLENGLPASILDVIDSPLLAAPFAYLLFSLF